MKPLGWIVAACFAIAWMTDAESPSELEGPVIVDAALASPAPVAPQASPVVDLDVKAKCKCGDDCKCLECDGSCDLPIAKVPVEVAKANDVQGIGTESYEDAVSHVQATGESVPVFFLDSRIPEMPMPRSGYVCDLAERSKTFSDYWLGKDTAPVTRTMIRLDTGKVASGEWYTSHPSVVKATATTRRTVRRLSGPTWNWAGADGKGKAWHLANEPEHASAGLTIEQLQGLSDRELNAIHDNLHNSGNRNPWGTGGGQLTSLPKVYQQSSGPCPGGNCPSSSRSRGRWGR